MTSTTGNKFSGQDEPLTDFPVRFSGQNDFPVEKSNRFSGLKTVGKALVLLYLTLSALIIVGCAVAMIVLLVAMWVQGFMAYPIPMLCGTVFVIVAYVACHVAVKRGFEL